MAADITLVCAKVCYVKYINTIYNYPIKCFRLLNLWNEENTYHLIMQKARLWDFKAFKAAMRLCKLCPQKSDLYKDVTGTNFSPTKV